MRIDQPHRPGLLKLVASFCFWSPALAVAAFMGAVFLASHATLPFVNGRLLDALVQHKSLSEVSRYCLFTGVVGVFYAGGHAIYTLLLNRWGEQCHARLRTKVFDHLMRLPLAMHERASSAATLSVLTEDCPVVARLYSQIAGAMVLAVCHVVFILVLLGVFYRAWLPVGLVLIPVYLTLPIVAKRSIRRTAQHVQNSKAQLSARIHELLRAIVDVKTYCLELWARNRASAEFQTAAALEYRHQRTVARWSAESALYWIIIGALYLALAGKVLAGEITIGQLVVITAYLSSIDGPIRQLVNQWRNAHTSLAAAERIHELLATNPEPCLPRAPRAPLASSISFENVSFRYSEPGEPVIRNFNLHIRPGMKVGLAGPSGSGKSTVAKLLLRLHECSEGTVLIGDRPITGIDPGEIRQLIGVLCQDYTLFDIEVGENIRLGRQEASDTMVRDAASRACADGFVSALPVGYSTTLGEAASKLSVGERRRIAIARLLLKDPEVIVLDEPFTALDPASAAAVRMALDDLSRGRTTILISHYLPDIMHLDWIVVLDHGRIAGQGTHEMLLESCRAYRELFRLQVDTEGASELPASPPQLDANVSLNL
jgi:ABC-type multidrug transport system fused ATPase/permease subunit